MFLLRAAPDTDWRQFSFIKLSLLEPWKKDSSVVSPQEISVKLEKHREARKFSNKLISSHSLKNIFDPYDQQQMLIIKLQLTSWDSRSSFTCIYQGLELESPRAKHRLVKTPVPGPSLPLNASPAAGQVPAQLSEEDDSELRFREKVSVQEEVGSICSKKGRDLSYRVSICFHIRTKTTVKSYKWIVRVLGTAGGTSHQPPPYTLPEQCSHSRLTPVICLGRRGCFVTCSSRVRCNCRQAVLKSHSLHPRCTPNGPASASACLRAEPHQSWRAHDAPQTGLLLRARVSEC